MSPLRHMGMLGIGLTMLAASLASGQQSWLKVYDSERDEQVIPGTTMSPYPWGELDGAGITSWYLISAAPDAKIYRLSLYVSGAAGSPISYDWAYRIKIGPTQDENITTNPDSQVSAYTTLLNNWNPKNTLVGIGWNDVDLQTPYELCSSNHYILKFEYVAGGSGVAGSSNAWQSTADHLPHDCYFQTAGAVVDYLPRLRMYGDGADLQAFSFTAAPDVLWTGRNTTLTLDIYNAGDVYIDHHYDVAPRYRKVGQTNWIEYPAPQEVPGHNALDHRILSWQFEWPAGQVGDYEFQVIIDLYREVVETDEDNNQLADVARYQAKDPPDPPIKTLILTDRSRMVSLGYSQSQVDDLMDDLDYLAENDPHGTGVVLELSWFFFPSSLSTARSNWLLNFGTSQTASATDAYVRAIDALIEERHRYYYPDLEQVIIVGSPEVIPMHVRRDERGTGGTSEISWTRYSDGLNPTDMYRLVTSGGAPGNYLTDAKYADLRYLDDAEESHLTRELAVARLVETPTQISTIIDNYFAVSGQNPMDDIACIGSFEFKDGAYKAAKDLEDAGYSPDKTLISNGFASTEVPTKITAKNDLVYIGGHSDYNSMATSASRNAQGILTITDNFWAGDHPSQGDTADLASLPTAVVVAAGCHAGALFPNMTHPGPDSGTTQYHDFPEEFAATGTIAYLGATGFTWITGNDGDSTDTDTGKSELLCSETVRQFASGKTIGQAYLQAANDYYLGHKQTLTNRDRKVLGVHQLYGIPSYQPQSGGLPSQPGFHFGNTTRQQVADTVIVQTTLYVDSWQLAPDGKILIPGATYVADPDRPVLPVVRYTEPDPAPVCACPTSVFFDEPGSQATYLPNAVPTASLAQNDAYVPPEPFVYPGFYPQIVCSGFKILDQGGQSATVGLVIYPVQFDPTTDTTRIWEQMTLSFKYRLAHVAFCDSFAGADLAKWTILTPQSSASLAQLDHTQPASTPCCLQILGASTQGDSVKVESRPIDIDFSRPYRIECLFRYSSFHWDRFLIFGHIRLLLDQPGLPILYDPVGDNSFVGNAIGPAFNTYAPPDTWLSVKVDVNPTAGQYTVRINNYTVGTVSYQQALEPSTTIWFEDNGGSTNYLNARYDDFLVVAGRQPPLAADFDHDGDVDLDDYAQLAGCLIGPGLQPTAPCQPCDLDNDGDIDLADFAIFAASFTGSQ